MKTGTEALRLLLLLEADIVVKKILQTMVLAHCKTIDLRRKELLCCTEVPCLCEVHSIEERCCPVRVEGTATSDRLVFV